MFNHKHYVPVLKTKSGERWALAQLSPQSKNKLTPLLELHPHSNKPLIDHADGVCASLAAGWGTQHPFFLDTRYYGVEGPTSAAAVQTVFNAARQYGLQAIPVTGPERSANYCAAVQAVAAQDGRGAMIRAYHDSVTPNFRGAAGAVLNGLRLPASTVDLLIDYRSACMALPTHLQRIPTPANWRTFTVASGCFPRSIGNYAQGTWHSLPRDDWANWMTQAYGAQIVRKPSFGDYAMRDTGAPAGGGKPSVNMRYAGLTDWKVRVGGKVADGASFQMINICHDLTTQTFFSGPNFSQGDQAIADCAMGTNGTGNVGQWLQWAMNHHFETVVNQIANLP